METHTFVNSCREFTPTLENVLVMLRLPIIADEGAMDLVLSKEEERKAQLLNAAFRVSNKSIYTFWVRYFREGEEQRKGVTLEAFMSY